MKEEEEPWLGEEGRRRKFSAGRGREEWMEPEICWWRALSGLGSSVHQVRSGQVGWMEEVVDGN